MSKIFLVHITFKALYKICCIQSSYITVFKFDVKNNISGYSHFVKGTSNLEPVMSIYMAPELKIGNIRDRL